MMRVIMIRLEFSVMISMMIKSDNCSKKGRKTNPRDYRVSRASPGQMVLMTVPRMIPLAIRIAIFYLGFKRKAKKAGKVFKKELMDNGIDPETAQLLTDEYMKSSHFFKGIRHAMFRN